MGTATLIPVSEYLSTSYDPDCEYVDGALKDRFVGEIDHSDTQSNLLVFLRMHYKDSWSGVEVRVQVLNTRFRVPDLVLIRGARPEVRIITDPPALVVEVVSPDDRAEDLNQKIQDYRAFGIPYIWVVFPSTRHAHIYTRDGIQEVTDALRAGDISVPFYAILT